MTKLLNTPEHLLLGRQIHGFHDDFYSFTAGALWTLSTDIDGAAAVQDAAGGKVSISSAVATAGNEGAYLANTKESFLFADDKPLVCEALLDYTEAATNQANVIVGLMDAVGVTALGNDGAGPKASYSGAVFYKADGETVWRCESSVATAQVTTVTASTAGGAAAQRLRIEFQPVTSSDGEVKFFIDDILVAKHNITFTSATEMQMVLGVKDGGAAAQETILADYATCYQVR